MYSTTSGQSGSASYTCTSSSRSSGHPFGEVLPIQSLLSPSSLSRIRSISDCSLSCDGAASVPPQKGIVGTDPPNYMALPTSSDRNLHPVSAFVPSVEARNETVPTKRKGVAQESTPASSTSVTPEAMAYASGTSQEETLPSDAEDVIGPSLGDARTVPEKTQWNQRIDEMVAELALALAEQKPTDHLEFTKRWLATTKGANVLHDLTLLGCQAAVSANHSQMLDNPYFSETLATQRSHNPLMDTEGLSESPKMTIPPLNPTYLDESTATSSSDGPPVLSMAGRDRKKTLFFPSTDPPQGTLWGRRSLVASLPPPLVLDKNVLATKVSEAHGAGAGGRGVMNNKHEHPVGGLAMDSDRSLHNLQATTAPGPAEKLAASSGRASPHMDLHVDPALANYTSSGHNYKTQSLGNAVGATDVGSNDNENSGDFAMPMFTPCITIDEKTKAVTDHRTPTPPVQAATYVNSVTSHGACSAFMMLPSPTISNMFRNKRNFSHVAFDRAAADSETNVPDACLSPSAGRQRMSDKAGGSFLGRYRSQQSGHLLAPRVNLSSFASGQQLRSPSKGMGTSTSCVDQCLPTSPPETGRRRVSVFFPLGFGDRLFTDLSIRGGSSTSLYAPSVQSLKQGQETEDKITSVVASDMEKGELSQLYGSSARRLAAQKSNDSKSGIISLGEGSAVKIEQPSSLRPLSSEGMDSAGSKSSNLLPVSLKRIHSIVDLLSPSEHDAALVYLRGLLSKHQGVPVDHDGTTKMSVLNNSETVMSHVDHVRLPVEALCADANPIRAPTVTHAVNTEHVMQVEAEKEVSADTRTNALAPGASMGPTLTDTTALELGQVEVLDGKTQPLCAPVGDSATNVTCAMPDYHGTSIVQLLPQAPRIACADTVPHTLDTTLSTSHDSDHLIPSADTGTAQYSEGLPNLRPMTSGKPPVLHSTIPTTSNQTRLEEGRVETDTEQRCVKNEGSHRMTIADCRNTAVYQNDRNLSDLQKLPLPDEEKDTNGRIVAGYRNATYPRRIGHQLPQFLCSAASTGVSEKASSPSRKRRSTQASVTFLTFPTVSCGRSITYPTAVDQQDSPLSHLACTHPATFWVGKSHKQKIAVPSGRPLTRFFLSSFNRHSEVVRAEDTTSTIPATGDEEARPSMSNTLMLTGPSSSIGGFHYSTSTSLQRSQAGASALPGCGASSNVDLRGTLHSFHRVSTSPGGMNLVRAGASAMSESDINGVTSLRQAVASALMLNSRSRRSRRDHLAAVMLNDSSRDWSPPCPGITTTLVPPKVMKSAGDSSFSPNSVRYGLGSVRTVPHGSPSTSVCFTDGEGMHSKANTLSFSHPNNDSIVRLAMALSASPSEQFPSQQGELDRVREALSIYEPFTVLDETQLETIARSMTRSVLSAGVVLVQAGNPSLGRLLILHSGRIEVEEGNGGDAAVLPTLRVWGETETFSTAGLSSVTIRVTSASAVVYSLAQCDYQELVMHEIDARRLLFTPYIVQAPLFQSLSAASRVQLADSLRVIHLPKGTTLHSKGQSAEWMYIIMSGQVRLTGGAWHGKENEASLRKSSRNSSPPFSPSYSAVLYGSQGKQLDENSRRCSDPLTSPVDADDRTKLCDACGEPSSGSSSAAHEFLEERDCGELIGDTEFVFKCKYLFTAVALTSVQVARLSRIHFDSIMSHRSVEVMKRIIAVHPSYLYLRLVASKRVAEEMQNALLRARENQQQKVSDGASGSLWRTIGKGSDSYTAHPNSSFRLYRARDSCSRTTAPITVSTATGDGDSHKKNTISSQLGGSCTRSRRSFSGGGSWHLHKISPNGEIIFAGRRSLYRFPMTVLSTANIIVIGVVMDGTIIRWNSSAQHVTGYTFLEVVGKNIFDLIVFEESKAQLKEMLQTATNYAGECDAYVAEGHDRQRVLSFRQNTGLYNVGLALTAIPSSFSESSDVILLVGKEAKYRAAEKYAEDVSKWLDESLKPHLSLLQHRMEDIEARNWIISPEDAMDLNGNLRTCWALVNQFSQFSLLNTDVVNECWRPVRLPAMVRHFLKEAAVLARETKTHVSCDVEEVAPRYEVFLDTHQVLGILRTLVQDAGHDGEAVEILLRVSPVAAEHAPGRYGAVGAGATSAVSGEGDGNGMGSRQSVESQVDVTPFTSAGAPAPASLTTLRQIIELSPLSLHRIRFDVEHSGTCVPSLHIPEDVREEQESSGPHGETAGDPRQVSLQHVHRIVSAMGGLLYVLPRTETHGGIIRFELPLLPLPGSSEEEEVASNPSPGCNGISLTVIVAESEPAHQQHLCQMMWVRRHAVVPVTTFKELLRLLDAGAADILLIDPLNVTITSDDIEALEGADPFDVLRDRSGRMVLVVMANDFTDGRVQRIMERNGVIELPMLGSGALVHIAMQEAERVVNEMRDEDERIELIRSTFTKSSASRHKVGRLVGKGAFGDVYEVEDTLTNGKMAMKRLRLNDGVIADEVVMEILAMTSLQHENIIHYFYCEKESDTQLRLYMELAPGGTLQSKIRQNPGVPLPYDQIVQHLADTCRGLAYVHSRGYVHGDMKTANLLIGPRGRIKIGDFGTAKQLRQGEKLYTLVGTPQYMAPEVLVADANEGSGYDFKADVWSIGCIVLEMATGQPPFAHLDCTHGMGMIKFLSELTDTPDLSPLQSGNPLVYEFVKNCLDINPDRRPSAQELLHFDILQGTIMSVRTERIAKCAELLYKLNKYSAMQEDSDDDVIGFGRNDLHDDSTCDDGSDSYLEGDLHDLSLPLSRSNSGSLTYVHGMGTFFSSSSSSRRSGFPDTPSASAM